MIDIVGNQLEVGSKVVYAVSSGSAGTLRVAKIVGLNPKASTIQVEIQGELSEWERRTFYTPYRSNKFYVVNEDCQ